MSATQAILTARIVCFYSTTDFTQNAKAHNQFVSVDTYTFKKLTNISFVAKGNKISD